VIHLVIGRGKGVGFGQQQESMKYQNLRLLRLITSGLFFAATITLHAASIEFQCAVSSGFNFVADSQTTIGYITSLTIGTTALRSDFSVKDPTTGTSIQAVAVLSWVSWAGGQADLISFTGQVSTANKQALTLLLHQALTNSQVQIGFKVFTYDPVAKKYYKAFFPATDATLKGLIAMSGTTPKLTIASTPGSDVQSPANFQMSLGVMPQPIAQTIQFATSSSTQVPKRWGVAAP
jgi:hypothetical protein